LKSEIAISSSDWDGRRQPFLVGRPWGKVLSVHLWLRFGALWFAVVLIGFIEGYVLLPFGLATFLGAVFSP
jgi:hypothetical protein